MAAVLAVVAAAAVGAMQPSPCEKRVCADGHVCRVARMSRQPVCLEDLCASAACTAGQVCFEGRCVAPLASGEACMTDDFQLQGSCATGAWCQRGAPHGNYVCLPAPCSGACDPKYCDLSTDTCVTGSCERLEFVASAGCPTGQMCNNAGAAGEVECVVEAHGECWRSGAEVAPCASGHVCEYRAGDSRTGGASKYCLSETNLCDAHVCPAGLECRSQPQLDKVSRVAVCVDPANRCLWCSTSTSCIATSPTESRCVAMCLKDGACPYNHLCHYDEWTQEPVCLPIVPDRFLCGDNWRVVAFCNKWKQHCSNQVPTGVGPEPSNPTATRRNYWCSKPACDGVRCEAWEECSDPLGFSGVCVDSVVPKGEVCLHTGVKVGVCGADEECIEGPLGMGRCRTKCPADCVGNGGICVLEGNDVLCKCEFGCSHLPGTACAKGRTAGADYACHPVPLGPGFICSSGGVAQGECVAPLSCNPNPANTVQQICSNTGAVAPTTTMPPLP